MIELNKIVIVGGGSAGWMSAATFVNQFPNKEIIVIESPNFPTVGVGESTLGTINEWLHLLGITDKDFMQHTDAVYKMAIKFTDFFKEDSGSFYYPFGEPYTEGTFNGLNDWYVKKSANPNLNVNDYAKTFFPALTLAEQNKLSFNESGALKNFRFDRDVAYHFDAAKFGQWLKNNYCLTRGVKLLQTSVESIITNENGIDYLILENGDYLKSDLFIDCTGFKSLLLHGALNEPFEDFSYMLPNNRAWATRIPYTDKEKEMEPYTNCTAIGNGWVWNIPSWERIGTGYVYSDKYINPEEALLEFKNYLQSNKLTIPNSNRNVESLEYADIKFKTGIYHRTWVKNVVAIGLSAAFIEPLESNGLYTTHVFLEKLMKALNRGTYNQWDCDTYNMATKNIFIIFAEFVAAHYAMSNRTDTQYWRDISNKTFQPKIVNLEPYLSVGFQDFADRKLMSNRYVGTSGFHCIATGMNFFPVDKNVIKLWEFHEQIDYLEKTKPVFDWWELLKIEWQEEADKSPSMYKWLKENVYNDNP